MNKREAAIITAMTKILFGPNGNTEFLLYVGEKFGRNVFIHEFAFPEFWEKLKYLAREDFTEIAENLEEVEIKKNEL